MRFATENCSYFIIERIEVPSGYYVRGVRGSDYVTWFTKDGNSFYFGNYFNGNNAKLDSKIDLIRRVTEDFAEELSRLEEIACCGEGM